MKPLFERAVIAGVGLIGGSLAAAGKKAGLFNKVVGLGRGKENLEKALSLGLVDEITTNIKEASYGADFFFAAVPVESITAVCLEAAENLKPGCVITDGGSVKEKIVEELSRRLASSFRFVGGHPVAGAEKSGASAASATLFKNRYAILTPTPGTDSETVDLVRGMWTAVGSDVVVMSPGEHDEAMAVVSHLPHFAAYALVQTIDESDKSGAIRRFIAGGFKDTTRIAASDPKMWRDIFSMNKERLLKSIGKFETSLAEFKRNVAENDFDSLEGRLEKIRAARLGMDDHSD